MALDEVLITRAIIERYTEKLLTNLDIDVAIVGGGPSGLTRLGCWPGKVGRSRFLNGSCPSVEACGAGA